MNDRTRRDILRLGLVAGVGAAAFPVTRTLADILLDEHLDSPPVAPFRVPLRIPPVLRPTRSDSTTDFYDVTQQVASVPILPGLPPTRMWSYNGRVPGPTIVQRQGRTVRVTQRNRLPVPVSVHLHGGDVPADSDGHPADLIPPGGAREYIYPGKHGPANLWYHDHAIHNTGRNVYMGLAALFPVTSDAEEALPLPKGQFDVPLIIQDKFFLPDAQIAYPRHDAEEPMRQGVFGDVILVNGTPKPFFRVARRRYRFRLLNGSNARVYRLRFSVDLPFTVIQSEGGFLPHPIQTREIEIAPSERYAVIVDFGRLPLGSKVVLRNVMQDMPGDPYDEGKTRDVMRFDVTTTASDPTSIPADLPPARELPNPRQAVATRTWVFARNGGEWTINDKPWDINRIDARPRLGTTEIWRFINKSGGWWHPIHVHLIEFAILSRTRRPLAPYELGPKDTVLLRDNEEAAVAMRWESFPGRYVMHCHNLEHEDHDMMTQFEVLGTGSG
jgi:spore coat protein A, manganese oxidase